MPPNTTKPTYKIIGAKGSDSGPYRWLLRYRLPYVNQTINRYSAQAYRTEQEAADACKAWCKENGHAAPTRG